MGLRIGLVALLAVAAVAAGCGGGKAPDGVVSVGRGAERAWVLRPDGAPKGVVVFVHGFGGPREIVPDNHLPWLRHLVEQGDAVVYPAYEDVPGQRRALPHLLAGVRNGMRELGDPDVPLTAIGYSRGGRLVVEWAALQHPAPKAVMSVFPSTINPLMEPAVDLGKLDPAMHLVVLVGDRDRTVGNVGAAELLQRLLHFGFPQQNIRGVVIRSTSTFTADHLSPLAVDAEAQRAFWSRADAMITAARLT